MADAQLQQYLSCRQHVSRDIRLYFHVRFSGKVARKPYLQTEYNIWTIYCPLPWRNNTASNRQLAHIGRVCTTRNSGNYRVYNDPYPRLRAIASTVPSRAKAFRKRSTQKQRFSKRQIKVIRASVCLVYRHTFPVQRTATLQPLPLAPIQEQRVT